MGYIDSVFMLVVAVILIGGSFWLVYYINSTNPNDTILTRDLCNSNGGRWNDCGNKCQIMAQGNPEIACAKICEQLCECGTIVGLQCPDKYNCRMPTGIADAMGYCEDN